MYNKSNEDYVKPFGIPQGLDGEPFILENNQDFVNPFKTVCTEELKNENPDFYERLCFKPDSGTKRPYTISHMPGI